MILLLSHSFSYTLHIDSLNDLTQKKVLFREYNQDGVLEFGIRFDLKKKNPLLDLLP